MLVRDFSNCNARLWNDKLGQISLATTTLFWGVSGNLRVIVFAWAAAALGYTTTQASSLVGVVAIGTAAGAIVASLRMRLDQATKVIPLGIAMGVLVIGLNVITNVWIAAPFLVLLGAIGGYLVVPMNALLQHRGANLMGAGRSIAVQNFNEQACILGLGAFYTGMTRFGLSAFTSIAVFGVLVAGTMWLIRRWHQTQLRAPPRRGRAPARDRAPRQALSASRRARGQRAAWRAGLQRVRLGHLVVAAAPAAGRAGCIRSGRRRSIFTLASLAIVARAAARAAARCCGTPALWLLVAAAGLTNAAFNWAIVHRRRRPRRAAVLPDAALDRAARARRARRAADAARRRCASRSALAGAAIVLWPAGERPPAPASPLLPLPRSLADWLGVLGGFSFAFNNVMLRREADAARGRPRAGDVPRRRARRRRARRAS